jgi:hypothetical protein
LEIWLFVGCPQITKSPNKQILKKILPLRRFWVEIPLALTKTTRSKMKQMILRLLAILGLAGCAGSGDAEKGDILLAKVYDKSLYRSQLEGIVPEGTGQQDSALVVKAYTERWIRETLLMYEAERNLPKDLDIDQLVRDYRASLVRFKFEEQMIAEKLDTVVTEAETRRFYESNKDQFQLESTILKCLVIKLPGRAPQTELNKLWNSRNPADEAALETYAGKWASEALLNRKKWYKLETIAALLPEGTLTSENIASRREGTLNDGGYRYYYRVLETVQGKTTAPFDYVREQASKVILHQRKQQLLEKWKQELYEKEVRRENVKIIQ